MPNFKMTFKTTGGILFSRVVYTNNHAIAGSIAKTMMLEEVYCNGYIEGVLSVKKTNEQASLNAWTDEHSKKILKRISAGLEKSGITGKSLESVMANLSPV